MREKLAISLQAVSKIYRLYGSQGDQLIEVLGLQRFGLKTRKQPKNFSALTDITLDVPRGHRIGIIGRNGAGKTTLLKLICGNFSATSGTVVVNGDVQALMNLGVGFHPDYTGRENVEASLKYNGLGKGELKSAIEGVIDFCELGDFLDQPFKTYSLGMQARLMFAAATAIRPDILIIDEVLGAGDAYFVAKSKSRVENMVSSGCTMLLVSHSMQQILELCTEAIWLDQGQIRMQGDAFMVVKAYEEYLHGPIQRLTQPIPITSGTAEEESPVAGSNVDLPDSPATIQPALLVRERELLLQEPHFIPHGETPALPAIAPPQDFKFVTRGGISRWETGGDLQICGFSIVTTRGETNKLVALAPAKFVLNVMAHVDGDFECRYGIVLLDHAGFCRARLISPRDKFTAIKGRTRCVEMLLNPVQLGPGEYIVSLSIHHVDHLALFNSTPRYDLLSRSFELSIEIQASLASQTADFFHSSEWEFRGS
jgi:lipopolysaccharide transport system ATP-binding protein